MLFHVTMTHSEDNCPMYNREKFSEVSGALNNLDALAGELNVKTHYLVVCGPNHVFFALLEADTLAAVSRFIFSIPMPQDTRIVPVEHMHDTVAMAKSVIEQGK